MNVKFTLNDLQRQRVADHLALVEQVLRHSISVNESIDGMGRLCQGCDSESFIGLLPRDPIRAKKSAAGISGRFF